jgi:STE24 endopeptidase
MGARAHPCVGWAVESSPRRTTPHRSVPSVHASDFENESFHVYVTGSRQDPHAAEANPTEEALDAVLTHGLGKTSARCWREEGTAVSLDAYHLKQRCTTTLKRGGIMSSRRVSIWLAVLAVLLITLPPPAWVLIEKSISDSAALGAARQISPESRSAARNQGALGYKLSPEKYARAVAYSHGEYWLYFVTTAYALLILWAMVRCQVSPRLRDWAENNSRRTWVQLALYAPTLLLILGVLLLPTDVYAQWHERKYGFSLQSWASWFGNWTRAEIATLLSGTLVVGLVYFIMRRSPRRWWLLLWMIAVPLIVLIVFIQPVVIDPLFSAFEPLDRSHPELVDSIEALVARAGLVIPREHIYLLRESNKSTEEYATSEGFGPTKRIFVSDTFTASEPGPAILPQLGHEIGHYVLLLDWISFAIGVLLSLVLLYLVDRVFVWAVARWGNAWRIRGPDDWASLPVLALIVGLIVVALTPAINGLSRYREHEADRCGLELVHGIVPNAGETAAQAFQKIAESSLSDPDPPEFIRWWLFDHPPANERIIFYRTYDPWSHGREPRYVK